VKRSQSAPWILAAGCGVLLLAGVVGRAPSGPGQLAVLPDGPPPEFAPRGPEALVGEPSVASGPALLLPDPEPVAVDERFAAVEFIARLPEGLATAPIELEHLWLPPGEPFTETFAAAAEGDPQSWARARSSSFGAAVFTRADLKPGTHLFRLRGRGSSVEVFGPFELRAGQRETLEAALWPGGQLHLEIVDAEGRRLESDELEGWSAEAYRGDHRQASPRAPRRGERGAQRFEFTRLSEGWQTVVLRDPAGEEFELPPVEVGLYGTPARVSFELPPASGALDEGAPAMGMQGAPAMGDF
jgi:hypothetical protein